MTGMDTVIEGEWKDVMPVIERAEKRLREKHDRVYMVLTLDDHVGVENRLYGAIEAVERELGRRVQHRARRERSRGHPQERERPSIRALPDELKLLVSTLSSFT